MNDSQVISDTSVRPVSKRLKIIFLFFALVSITLNLVLALSSGNSPSNPLAAHDLQILEWVLGFLSLYSVAAAAAFQYWRVPILARLKLRLLFISKETTLWLMIHTFLYSPALYGILLYYCGMSVTGLLAYTGISLALTLGFSIYDLRSD